jgi:hypothetical protein
MKIIYSITLLLSFCITTIAQNFYNSENELHANYKTIQHATPIMKDQRSVSTWMNINISGNAAPQNEPSVRISRVDPNVVVAAWRDFRLGYQEPDVVRRIGYSYSADGGLTWSTSQLLPDPNPDHISQSDPVVTSDMDGNFYISSTSRQPVNGYNREMLLYKSTDNGQTFSLHAIAVPGSGGAGEDKEWLFCDPVPENQTYNQLMMVWRSFGPAYGIRFRKSDIGGAMWSDTKNVSDFFSGQGANITTGVNGEIVVVWKDEGIWMDRSLDGGETFGEDEQISSYEWDTYGSFPFLCTDYSQNSTRGNIYLVWADNRYDDDDVWFQRSVDGGETWLDFPIRVNDVSTYDQFWPVIQCDTNGRIFVIYYDDRNFPGLYDAWLAWSDNAGNTWENAPLSDLPFYFNMPNSNVRFGDYIGLDTYAGKVVPVWTDDRTGDFNQEIYTAWVDIYTAIKENNWTEKSAFLHPVFPNPFENSANIRFELDKAGYVRLTIMNSLGQIVEMLFEGNLDAGEYQYKWNNKSVPGIYYCVLTTSSENLSQRMISIKN